MGPDRLGEWRVSAARAGAEMALRFALSWHPDLQLDALMGQWAGLEQHLQEQAGRIASRASYITEFAFHDEFHPERTEDGVVANGDDYGLLHRDPEGISKETGIYGDAEAEEDTGASLDPEAGRTSLSSPSTTSSIRSGQKTAGPWTATTMACSSMIRRGARRR